MKFLKLYRMKSNNKKSLDFDKRINNIANKFGKLFEKNTQYKNDLTSDFIKFV